MARNTRIGRRQSGALAGMYGVLTLVFLFLSTWVPDSLAFLFLSFSGIFIGGLLAEDEMMGAIGVYIVCACIGVIILADWGNMAPYVLFFGWYGVVKVALDDMRDRITAWCLKLTLFNATMALALLLAPMPLFTYLLERIPLLFLLFLGQLLFLVFDAAIYLMIQAQGAVFRKYL